MKRQSNLLADFNVRTEGDEDAPTITGYAARFNHEAHGEIIRPGAFTKTLQEAKRIVLLWNHDHAKPIASTDAGTLELFEDELGLGIRATPNMGTTWAQDAVAAIAGGEVSQMSFGFDIVRQRMTQNDEGDTWLRELLEVKLYEVSAVTFPWYDTTEVSVREDAERNGTTLHIDRVIEPAQAGELVDLVRAFVEGGQTSAESLQNGDENPSPTSDEATIDTSAETQEGSADADETEPNARDWDALKKRIETAKGKTHD